MTAPNCYEWWKAYNSPVSTMHAYILGSVVGVRPIPKSLCGRNIKHVQGPYSSPTMTVRSPVGESFCRICWNRVRGSSK